LYRRFDSGRRTETAGTSLRGEQGDIVMGKKAGVEQFCGRNLAPHWTKAAIPEIVLYLP
jgi:hypothetical protein